MTKNSRTVGNDRQPVPLRRLVPMFVIMLLSIFGCVEALTYFVVIDPKRVRYSGMLYDPSSVTQDYAYYLAHRDLKLGWGPSPPSHAAASGGSAGEHTAADLTREDPAFPVTAQPCVSLFGDSFTWATEVADGEAWGSLLARKIQCRVANYGVGGYGSDQAYLRYLSLPPKGRVVLLNHLSENILRNVNQFRNLLYTAPWFGRFVVNNGTLQLIPIPQIAPSDISAFLAEPVRYLEHEYFFPGGPAGVEKIEFPYSVTAVKMVLWDYQIHASLASRPRHMEFYRTDHASKGLEVTFAILRSFVEMAESRKQVAIVTIIPTCDDLIYFHRTGAFPYDALKKLIVANNLRFIDFGEKIAARVSLSAPEALYVQCYGHHFNATGNRLLADIAFEYMQGDHDLLEAISAGH